MPVSMKTVWNVETTLLSPLRGKLPRVGAAIGAEYTNDVKMSMRSSPRGGTNTNKRGQKRSAPGEPPAPEFGDLIRSIRFQVRKTMTGVVVECGSTLRKAVYLEFGAARGRVMQARDMSGKFTQAKTMSWVLFPRPVWGPAILRLRRKMPALLARLKGKGA